MKTKLGVLSLLIVFSSCYSYKALDRDVSSYQQGERIKIITSDQKSKGRFITHYSDTIMIKNANRETEWYSLSEIKEIRTAKFSLVKTMLIPPAALYGIALGYVVIFGQPSFESGLEF